MLRIVLGGMIRPELDAHMHTCSDLSWLAIRHACRAHHAHSVAPHQRTPASCISFHVPLALPAYRSELCKIDGSKDRLGKRDADAVVREYALGNVVQRPVAHALLLLKDFFVSITHALR